jgi:hypothetical protein
MNTLRARRGSVLSAGIAAGLLGLLALAPSAYAQYWNGAPNATGPGTEYGPAPYAEPTGPMWFAPPANGPVAAGPSQPYWLGAPNAVGPGE